MQAIYAASVWAKAGYRRKEVLEWRASCQLTRGSVFRQLFERPDRPEDIPTRFSFFVSLQACQAFSPAKKAGVEVIRVQASAKMIETPQLE